MRLKKVTIISILSIAIILSCSGGSYKKKTDLDAINGILKSTGSEVEEYGVSVTYKTTDDFTFSKLAVEKIAEILIPLGSSCKEEKHTKESDFCIEFTGDKITGYIESSKNGNTTLITINYNCKASTNKSKELENRITGAILKAKGYGNTKLNYFTYIKAKLKNSDLATTNKNIIDFLKSMDSNNIYTIKLDEGYSTVANTGQYNAIRDNGELEDLNFALMDYNSGSIKESYIILGTPDIIIPY